MTKEMETIVLQCVETGEVVVGKTPRRDLAHQYLLEAVNEHCRKNLLENGRPLK